MNNYLHIVCFDAPSPPNYGGAIELFYKIEALAKAGSKIILHYFDYRREGDIKDLEKHCALIYSYKRKTGLRGLSFTKPYIVSSRINSTLIDNLNKDEHPILLEGIHCTGILPHINKNNRKIIIRVHNNEAAYYRQLAANESNLLKKLYYFTESSQLAIYQKRLPHNCAYACLSEKEQEYFARTLHLSNACFVPCFLPWQALKGQIGKGSYCLYHGNLSVAENRKAVNWLVEHVFSELEIPLVIAGKNMPGELKKYASVYNHITAYNNPSEDHMSSLIRQAHINLVPVFNNTGVKLKLLHALFEGRFCITNENGIAGSAISKGIMIANTPEEWITVIKKLCLQNFTQEDLDERSALLDLYNNQKNAQNFSALYWHYQ